MAIDSDVRLPKDPFRDSPASADSTDSEAIAASHETEDCEQLLQELRQTKTEQAVTERRNRKLTLVPSSNPPSVRA